jgi:5-bromo-4-chloroindolyl phosphate hydrolysis protein
MVKIEKIPAYTYKELKKQVKKTRIILDLLESELEERSLEKQHDEVDCLDKHLDNAGVSLRSLVKLMSLLKSEKNTEGE